MSSQEVQDQPSTWSNALKKQVVWFVFAILLAAGTSYMNAKIQIASIESRVARAEEDISEIEDVSDENEDDTQGLEIIIVRLEEKIDAILIETGIRPSDFHNGDTKQEE